MLCLPSFVRLGGVHLLNGPRDGIEAKIGPKFPSLAIGKGLVGVLIYIRVLLKATHGERVVGSSTTITRPFRFPFLGVTLLIGIRVTVTLRIPFRIVSSFGVSFVNTTTTATTTATTGFGAP